MGRIDVLQLQCDLQTAQADFNKWAGDLVESIERIQSDHAKALKQGEGEWIQLQNQKCDLEERAAALKQKQSKDDAECQALQSELENVQKGEVSLPSTLEGLRAQVQDLASALKRETEATAQSKSRHSAKLATLQMAAGFYKQYMGLEFKQGTAEGELQVALTRVDPSDPERSFSFTVQITDGGIYHVANFEPAALECAEEAEKLNATGDFSKFVKAFRAACKLHCREGN